ncbi:MULTISPECIES: hypothetical protein [Myxococcus]|uniref:Uncharacterized protein n=1 Tax=Myxococcus llanfairpwllgwyngyllgogerychwyrndrobwllllantysiliogogogochensis TaxID=2590453 RepID=A0A540WVB6_9BACT|nr:MULTISPECIES: hypothetical protein [Myxococcus]NTX07367.1 hypothetical protein [Myxococcus sp. CA040A]TQF12897.1 hypothetical protein FJV41_26630 [Myxococcus llanfairpwllgwyngyllgogerychwyrndrobwllllantysiliogogogochensis]
MKKTLTAGMLVLLVALPAGADEIDDKVRAVEDNLSRIKDKLDGIVSDSSSSDIDSALDTLGNVRNDVERLRSLNPPNDPGKTMANSYLDYISKFRESAQYLKRMKDAQVKADESRLAERCNEAERNLKSFIQTFVDKKDPTGVFKIPDEAEKIGRIYNDEYRKHQEVHGELDRWRSYARNFSESHNRWSDVKGELQDGVNDIWDRWNRRMEETKSKCVEVAKGKEFDAAKDAMSKLGNFGQVRTVIRKKLDERLQTIASKVRDLDSRSGDASSEISEALRAVEDVLGFLGDLKDIQGEDSEARQLVERWPAPTRSLKEALESIRRLKSEQYFLEGDVRACRADEVRLQETIREQVGNKDNHAQGVVKLKEMSDSLERTWTGKKAETDRQKEAMERRAVAAKAFSFTEGNWSSIKSNLDASADKILAYWNTRRSEIYEKDPCKNLVLGEKNPDVARADQELKRYAGGIAENYRALRKDFLEWERDVLAFRKTAKQDADAIRDAFCKEYDWEQRVKEISDSYASTLNSQWGSITGRYDRMLKAVEVLVAEKKVKSAPKLQSALISRMKSIENIKEGQLLGSNSPKVRAHIRYGQEEHKRRQASSCSEGSEISIEATYCDNPNPRYKGRGCRIDCIHQCQVLEIKPDNIAEMEKGDKQGEEYTKALHKKYKALGDAMFKESGYEELADCEDRTNKRLNLSKHSVVPYPFCADRDGSFFPMLGEMPTDQPPENPNDG